MYSEKAERQAQQQLAQQVALQREATASLFDKKAGQMFARHIEDMTDG